MYKRRLVYTRCLLNDPAEMDQRSTSMWQNNIDGVFFTIFHIKEFKEMIITDNVMSKMLIQVD